MKFIYTGDGPGMVRALGVTFMGRSPTEVRESISWFDSHPDFAREDEMPAEAIAPVVTHKPKRGRKGKA